MSPQGPGELLVRPKPRGETTARAKKSLTRGYPARRADLQEGNALPLSLRCTFLAASWQTCIKLLFPPLSSSPFLHGRVPGVLLHAVHPVASIHQPWGQGRRGASGTPPSAEPGKEHLLGRWPEALIAPGWSTRVPLLPR